MITFNKPDALNGEQLRTELRLAGISISDEITAVSDSADGYIHLDIAAKDESKAAAIVTAHKGTTVAPDLSAQRQAILDRLGLTAEEAALLLG